MDVHQPIREFVRREFLFGDESRMPGPSDPLLGAGGVVDSVGLHQLILFLEKEFGIQIDDLDIVPENFETLVALKAFVDRKRSGA